MSRRLDDLCPRIKGRIMVIAARLVETGRPFLFVDTLRTAAEQAENLNKGVSWTQKSKHLPQADCDVCKKMPNSQGTRGLSHAVDFAPYEVFLQHGKKKLDWDPADPFWGKLGSLAETEGLRWGGRWKQADLGHVEVKGD